jgi:hypothetical protein
MLRITRKEPVTRMNSNEAMNCHTLLPGENTTVKVRIDRIAAEEWSPID